MGNTVSQKFDENSVNDKSESDVKSNDDKKSPAKKTEEKTKKSAAQDSKTGGGWFSSLFGKPKNQMILPDDKNPAVRNHFLNNKILFLLSRSKII